MDRPLPRARPGFEPEGSAPQAPREPDRPVLRDVDAESSSQNRSRASDDGVGGEETYSRTATNPDTVSAKLSAGYEMSSQNAPTSDMPPPPGAPHTVGS